MGWDSSEEERNMNSFHQERKQGGSGDYKNYEPQIEMSLFNLLVQARPLDKNGSCPYVVDD